MATRANVAVRLHEGLIARARAYGEENGLKLRQVIELALAEFFAIPPAVEGADMPLALCPQCGKAVIVSSRCELCNWHVHPRPWKPRKQSKARTRARHDVG